MTPHKVRKEILIDAPVNRVWNALTDTGKVGRMMFNCQVETDWSPGSPIRFSGTYRDVAFQDGGTILSCNTEEKLEYSYWSSFSGTEDKPENYSTVRYELAGTDDGKTALTLTQENIHSAEAAQHSKSGWDHALEQLKVMAESGG